MSGALADPLPRPSAERLTENLRALEAFTRPDRPYTRRAFSDEDRAARAWLAARMAEAGLAVTVDAAGNQIGRSPETPGAGAHDRLAPRHSGDGRAVRRDRGRPRGARGRALPPRRRPPPRANFTCEEPSDFGLSTIGSRAMSGKLDSATAARLRDRQGRTLAEAIDSVGGRGTGLDAARRVPGDVARYLELHIEQAVSLVRAGVPLGVVTAIAAPSRYRVAMRGRQDHAGGTPMGGRRDALAAAAELVLLVERFAYDAGRGMVGTVGSLEARPNMINIVPGEADLLVDFRGIDAAAIAETLGGRLPRGAGSRSSGRRSCGRPR